MRRAARALALVAALFAAAAQAQPEHPEIAKRRAAERRTFTDAEIQKGFFATAFGAEMRIAGRVDGIRKYIVPVRVFVENRARPDRSAQVARVVADIGSRIANIDIALTQERKSANIVVRLLNERDFAPTLRKASGNNRAGKIQKSLEPQCLSGFRKDSELRIVHSDVFLVADRGDFIFYDCAYEELLQSLGPINDTDKVAWTMFNDDVQMGFFDVYDQYILNIIYHPKVQPGMTRDQVRALLPEIMPEVRAFVAKVNGLAH
ncbi:MAG: DUF2927 domain-containing protein [Alphaproteobacteria bacterium]|nr:MAG: DUF2927 domain-containing protein [Alphaproteobacteria bacterium]